MEKIILVPTARYSEPRPPPTCAGRRGESHAQADTGGLPEASLEAFSVRDVILSTEEVCLNRFLYRVRLCMVVAVLAATVIMAAPVAALTVLAGPVVNPANGHSYYLLSPTSSWFEAETAAVDLVLGGHLATVNDGAEYQWIKDHITPLTGEGAPVWIGLNDVASENQFVWVSGEATPAWGAALTPVPRIRIPVAELWGASGWHGRQLHLLWAQHFHWCRRLGRLLLHRR